MYKKSTTDDSNKICKCCNGSGTQTRYDGIVIECPCCNGTGYKNKYLDWTLR